MRRYLIASLLVVLACSYAEAGLAAGVETLLMPGKVTAAHEELEEDCGQCHDRRDRARQTQLCLDCHEDVAADVRERRGFHGRMPNADRSQCNACHSEHKGRDADIVKLNAAAFDHSLTDFPLENAHAGLTCASCHTSGQKHREAYGQCVDCHGKRDPHDGRLGSDCAACHSASVWPKVRFDHARTKFPLTGKHRDATCAACHPGNKFAKTPQQCVACHAVDDVHRGSRGAACVDCHGTDTWRTTRFDHAKETGFPLLGAHSNLDCQSCHRSGDFKRPLERECSGCHRGDDAHAGRFDKTCDRCHTNEAWKPSTFDHPRDAGYELLGRHAKLDCHTCHTGNLWSQKLSSDCRSCHGIDDVHGGTAGMQCEQCHGAAHWRPAPGFDHDFSGFPLVGLHVVVPCAQCHTSLAFGKAASDCNSCHAQRDVHRGGLGAQCAECHSPNGWNIWQFDHAQRTRFALTGAHMKAPCAACHREPAGRVQLPTDCASCHQQDDVHLGQFGRQCQQCHQTTTFRGARRR